MFLGSIFVLIYCQPIWITILPVIVHGVETTGIKEYCFDETFHAKCDTNEVIMMTDAMYGRMRVGRCVPIDLGEITGLPGYLGCFIDVLHLLHNACSGKDKCDYDVTSRDLIRHKPCVQGLQSYLEASYECLSVAVAEKGACPSHHYMKLLSTKGYLSSHVAHEDGCGTMMSPWRIEVRPGQTVNITLIDFSKSNTDKDYSATKMSTCNLLGYITDTEMRKNVSVCSTGSAAEHHIFSSVGHNVDVQIITGDKRRRHRESMEQNREEFILKYEVTGCPDLQPPEFAWYEREGSLAMIGCEHSKKTWHMRCEGSRWIGVVGNCPDVSTPATSEQVSTWLQLPQSVTIVATVGCAIGIALLLVTCGFVYLARRHKSTGHPLPTVDQTYVDQGESERWYYKTYPRTSGTLPMQACPPYRPAEYKHIWETPLPEPFTVPQTNDSEYGSQNNSAIPPLQTGQASCPLDASSDQSSGDATDYMDGEFLQSVRREVPKYAALDKDLVQRDA